MSDDEEDEEEPAPATASPKPTGTDDGLGQAEPDIGGPAAGTGDAGEKGQVDPAGSHDDITKD